ncbi:MAG TPA: fused MFS/spermidine synthase [Vicinamibacterales bacterium]|nr:fused MFS/spermidine synthase [Vicinamibacterales bacterium]HPW20256.1 fused MFS/spermidine synthase [Vicinamibacterales bacterium]
MPRAVVGLVYLLFFLSGAAALVYQVVWVRSLTLVFGGSHLAVTAVLSIFMAGLAAGGFLVGRRVDGVERPLRLYGFLELGIAASALAAAGLMRAYPSVYAALAQGRDDAPLYLTLLRIPFAAGALIVPTTLMGGTLPVLSRFVARQPQDLRGYLSFLYGFNTLGSVLGAFLAGFVFLRLWAVSTTLYVAVAASALIGVISLALSGRLAGSPVPPSPGGDGPAAPEPPLGRLPFTLVLWGIGVSGFCALGYEVLWTRVLTIAVGASVYGFTIILVAFLTGIALGSEAYGVFARASRAAVPAARRVAAWFGATQIAVGVTALLVTVYLRDIPVAAVRLQGFVFGSEPGSFQARTWANFGLAFLYMVVPAFFMGAAFPLAGDVVARQRRAVGRGVGDVFASNTVGSILGAAVSGLILIRLVGIERSLQLLTVANAGLGLLVLASLRRTRWLPAGAAACTAAVLAFLASSPDAARVWDRKYFAIYRSNQPEAFRTPEMVREAVENTDVLYYSEGVESTVSVIRVKGGEQAFVTNGRIEASTHLQAQQVQFTLGHLPMLLCERPSDVLVVGMGSGMTAGATAVHPGVDRVTLVEIEGQVRGVARTFSAYNHNLLDHPKVSVVVNDGRNFLTTTNRTFDVITADPIHPWFRGAGYLYSSEYFALAARHLRPGGVIAQWLPLYELRPEDLASVVKTVRQHFAHTMLWVTHYDAVIVGRGSPFLVDEADLDRRIAAPGVAEDLRRVNMGSAADLLAYFLMGTEGMTRFGRNGVLNTDDRLYLEFSAPFSMAAASVMRGNVEALAAHRESILPYLKPAGDAEGRRRQEEAAARQAAAGRMGDEALARYLAFGASDPRVGQALRRLTLEHPGFAPGRALWAEREAALALEPRLLQEAEFQLTTANALATTVRLSAVLVPVSRSRASIMFVDNRARAVYGQVYIDDYDRDGLAGRTAADVLAAVSAAYDQEAAAARERSQGLPPAEATLARFKAVIDGMVRRGGRPGS